MVSSGGHRRARGFTLVELLVAGAVGIVILTAAAAYLIHRARVDQREAQLARLKRDASLFLGQLERELRQAGLGRPTRSRWDGNEELFPGPLLAAEETRLVFVADLPRPDSSLNGLSSFAANQTLPALPAGGVAVLNELNGGCDVDSSLPTTCRTDEASLLLAAPGPDCSGAPGTAPTCPWALGKYRADEALVLVDGRGRWTQRNVHADVFRDTFGRFALLLDAPLPAGFFGMPNRGWVASLDRVHYRLTGTTVQRKQCWNEFPTPADLADTVLPCGVSPTEGTDWEPLLSSVPTNGLRFRYLDASGAVLGPLPLSEAALRRVRRVELQLRLEAPAPGGPMVSDTLTAVTLRH
jgi:type II secretory pathway pseudopilin PulG